jgi:hypothetical protein
MFANAFGQKNPFSDWSHRLARGLLDVASSLVAALDRDLQSLEVAVRPPTGTPESEALRQYYSALILPLKFYRSVKMNEGLPSSSSATTSPSITASSGKPVSLFTTVGKWREILLIPVPELCGAPSLSADRAEAVELQLVAPFAAFGRFLRTFAEHRLEGECLGTEHRMSRCIIGHSGIGNPFPHPGRRAVVSSLAHWCTIPVSAFDKLRIDPSSLAAQIGTGYVAFATDKRRTGGIDSCSRLMIETTSD